MEGGRTAKGYSLGQFESASRCLQAAMRQSDRCVREALGRAGLRYLAGAMGIDGAETQRGISAPARAQVGNLAR
jgi:hypothetical protein